MVMMHLVTITQLSSVFLANLYPRHSMVYRSLGCRLLLEGGFKHSSTRNPGEMIQFDKYFSDGLVQPPTRLPWYCRWLKSWNTWDVSNYNIHNGIIMGYCAYQLVQDFFHQQYEWQHAPVFPRPPIPLKPFTNDSTTIHSPGVLPGLWGVSTSWSASCEAPWDEVTMSHYASVGLVFSYNQLIARFYHRPKGIHQFWTVARTFRVLLFLKKRDCSIHHLRWTFQEVCFFNYFLATSTSYP